MEGTGDVHMCLRCGTHIKGLMAYVEHCQSSCSGSTGHSAEADETGDAEDIVKQEIVTEDEIPLVDEIVSPSKETDSTSSPVSQTTRRGRKRKQAAPQPSPKKASITTAAQETQNRQTRQKTPERDRISSALSCAEESPRRSSRKGIRISYTILLSGVDRSDAEKVVKLEKAELSKGGKGNTPPRKEVGKVNVEITKETSKRGRKKKDEKAKSVEEMHPKNLKLDPRFKIRIANKKTESAFKKRKRIKVTTKKVAGEKVRKVAKGRIRKVTGGKVNKVAERKMRKVAEGKRKKAAEGKGKKAAEEKRKKDVEEKRKKIANEKDVEATEKTDDEACLENGVVSKEVGLEDKGDDIDDSCVVYIKDGKFFCNICQIYCLTQKKIEVHCATRKHAKKCRGEFGETSRLKKDVSEENELTENLRCEICNYETRKEKMMRRHMSSISHAQKANEDLYECTECHKKFKAEDELETHKLIHDIPTCRKCKETFETAELLEEHIEEENHRIEFRCAECGKTYSNRGNLASHERNHDPDKQFKCEICPYTASQMADMRKHMLRHQGLKPFKCGLCEYESLTKNGVDRHMKTHMIRTRDLKCDECESAFFDDYLLKQHKYMKHNPERRFPCKMGGCTFAFKYRSSLLTHQRMHTQEKPFLCSECGYATSTKYSLTKHIRLHTGEKPFRCDFPNCNYASRLSTHLGRHKIIHTGAKPFKCPFCKYTCNNKQNLRKHLLTTKAHAGVKMYKCNTCTDFSTNSFRDYVIHIRKEHAGEDEYISYFEVAESVNNKAEEQQDSSQFDEDSILADSEGVAIFDEADLQSFSVVTVVPGRCGVQEQMVTVLDDREEVQKKLEQVILALEDNGSEVVSTGTDNETNVTEQLQTSVPIQVNSMEELITLTRESLPMAHEGDTILIVPEMQAETEICTTEAAGTVVTPEMAGATIALETIELDQSGRLVSEEDMAAATWLHNMQNVPALMVETVVEEVLATEADPVTDEEQG